jgi:twitching motility protein PilI
MVDNLNFLLEERQDQAPEFQEFQNPEGELYLRFAVTSGQEFALPATGIREVMSLLPNQITPIPNTSPLLLGTLNLRGQAVWVADLSQFLDNSTPLRIDRSEISIIAIEDQEVVVGLAVERIVGMDWLEPSQLQVSNNVSDNLAPFLQGEWLIDEQSHQCLQLLDPVTMLRSARWTA